MSKRERIMVRCRTMFILEFGVGCAGGCGGYFEMNGWVGE